MQRDVHVQYMIASSNHINSAFYWKFQPYHDTHMAISLGLSGRGSARASGASTLTRNKGPVAASLGQIESGAAKTGQAVRLGQRRPPKGVKEVQCGTSALCRKPPREHMALQLP